MWRGISSSAVRAFAFLIVFSFLIPLAACAMPGDAAPVVKIGLIAPFEGQSRPLGYAVLPAVRATIAEANASGELGRYRVALVALNDDQDPSTAAAQARALSLDPDILAVVGPFDPASSKATAPILSEAGLAYVAVPGDTSQVAKNTYDAEIARAIEATRLLLKAIAGDIGDHGRPGRAGVREQQAGAP